MMRTKLFFCSVAIFGLVGCETLMTRSEVEHKRQMQDSVSTLQRTTADTNNRFTDIESDLRSFNGRIEVLENKANLNQQDRERNRQQNEQMLQDQNRKVQVLQEEVTRLSEAVATLTAEISGMKAALNESATSTASAPAKKDLFDQAEESFEKKDWKKAVLSYQKFRDTNPKSKKFPEATYKIGVCFQELGMKDEAKTFYDEVIAKFPKSAEAKKASSRLKNLKK